MQRFSIRITTVFWLTLAVVVAICGTTPAPSTAAVSLGSGLISQDVLRNVGLSRSWFAQAQLNPARNHVERAVLSPGRLTVLTSAGVVQELNADTGETLWTAAIGNDSYPSLGPCVSDQFVALVNGSTLYVLDRKDGRPTIIKRVGGAPGAAPALGPDYVFVPLVSGRMEAYPLMNDKEKKLTPWYYQSKGRSMVPPLATPESVVWTTDIGYLYVGRGDRSGMRFRMNTGSEIVAQPAYLKPYVYVTSEDGEVFALDEMTGARHWKYPTGFPIDRAAAPVGNRIFVTSDEPALHCIDAVSGDAFWEVPRVQEFAAASKTRVYGIDDLGGLVILDGANGSFLGRIATDRPLKALVNEITDRIYLVSDDGTIECLREIDSKEPLYHNPKPKGDAKKPATAPQQPATDAAEQPAATPTTEEASPFEEPAAPAAKAAEPPAGAPKEPEKPAGNFGTNDENPFGT
jgi:hypothetical protein